MKYLDYDLSQLPLVLARVNPVDPSLEQYKAQMIDTIDGILKQNDQMIWAFNFKHVKLVPSEHRIAMGNWVRANLHSMKTKVRCIIMVDVSLWTNLVVKGIQVVTAVPVPLHTCRNTAEVSQLLKEKYNVHHPYDFSFIESKA